MHAAALDFRLVASQSVQEVPMDGCDTLSVVLSALYQPSVTARFIVLSNWLLGEDWKASFINVMSTYKARPSFLRPLVGLL